MNNIADNVWAVVVIVVGVGTAIAGAHMNSKDLLTLGSTVAGYGAAWFQASRKASQNS